MTKKATDTTIEDLIVEREAKRLVLSTLNRKVDRVKMENRNLLTALEMFTQRASNGTTNSDKNEDEHKDN